MIEIGGRDGLEILFFDKKGFSGKVVVIGGNMTALLSHEKSNLKS